MWGIGYLEEGILGNLWCKLYESYVFFIVNDFVVRLDVGE